MGGASSSDGRGYQLRWVWLPAPVGGASCKGHHRHLTHRRPEYPSLNVLNRTIPVVYSRDVGPISSLKCVYNCLSETLLDVVPALPDGRRLQPRWIRQSEGDHGNWYRRCHCRQGNSLVKEVKKKQLCVTSPNVSLCSCPESRRGGRVCPTSRRHGQQDLRRSPGQG